MRRFGLLMGLLTLPAERLSAQHAGKFEVGAFGSYTSYDDAFGLARKIGGGARLGYFFGDVVGLEADVLFQPAYTFSAGGTPATMQPLIGSGSVVVNLLHGGRLMLYVLGGYSLLDFGTRAPFDFSDHGVHGGAGARAFLSSRIALRIEGRGIYAPDTKSAFGSSTVTHVAATAGLSVFHLGGPPKDSDKDGITDKKDACPNTPLGANVDPRGCPLDSDGDRVFDGLDKCPETPRGAQVDAGGCPTDADADGVPDGIDECPDTPAGVQVDARGCSSDSDADGVPDGPDQCPNTPAGATVDSAGCPSDTDKDGVPDGFDQCPGTPAGAVVDPKGCPLDADVDGVPDGLDQCPNTPAGARVDASGCPLPTEVIRDSDSDGVLDTLDKCPNTPPGSKVDANGCIILFQPEITPGAPARPTLILRGVNFETGRSALTRESYAILDQVAGSLIANPDIRIEIAGYTDSTGRRASNLWLSRARAGAVRAYLARKGVAPGRMVANGYGASGYIAPNTTAAGRAQNRRVELHKLP
ncbi:MAG TPA: thrombospondin type 3 repeat-containing protein [Gemmatimonadales bacterium]|nr:thrombospondin type 3 repeat-containing protein [Gemmatimonadales bacterium]